MLREVVAASRLVATTSSRLAKVDALAACLRDADADEMPIVVAFLAGEVRQRRLGAGYSALRGLPPPAATATLTVGGVDAALAAYAEVAGTGSRQRRRELLDALFAAATEEEQDFLARLALGELRQGALDGVMTDAAALAADVPVAAFRRALMLRGDLGVVAAAAVRGGVAGLEGITLRPGRPLRPMLASSAGSVTAALARDDAVVLEYKLDGIRIQAHRDADGRVAVYSRGLDDLTARLPEIVEAVHTLRGGALVLDGETLALRPDGRPHPFQVTASRTGSSRDVAALRATSELSPFFFDLLHRDGEDLLDLPYEQRFAALAELVPEAWRVPRLVPADAGEAEGFLAEAIAAGHEGVVVKSLSSPYLAGRRGAGWVKVKPRHTLDLVVLAAEWGHGRRRGWLSNLHLGARDPAGGFVMLGKTFKGLTDQVLAWQTERLRALRIAAPEPGADAEPGGESGERVVRVRPELVVEIAFDGVQRSTRYPGGLALRFARVVRFRPDKRAAEADTIDAVRAIDAAQRGEPPPPPEA